MKFNKISRITQLLIMLQAGKSCTAGDLSKLFGMSRRTIFRDLKMLHTIGVPYHYDAKSGSYTIDPEFFLPPIDLNLQEALSLLLLVYKAANQMQLPFKHSAMLAALKIESNLPIKIRRYCTNALQNISTKLTPQAPMNLLNKTFTQLQNAITKKYQVNIQYHSLFERKMISLCLHPYHLLYNRQAWYVLGYSNLHKNIRTFKLNRIRELKVLNKRFFGGKTFKLFEYLGKAWSMIPEGKIYNIKLRFLPKVADNVTEVQWHSTQKAAHNSDGSATVEFRVDGLNEITWWLLGYGDQVQILTPKALKERFLGIAKNMVKLNQ